MPLLHVVPQKKHPAGILSMDFVNFWKLSSHLFITFCVVKFGGLEINGHVLEKHT